MRGNIDVLNKWGRLKSSLQNKGNSPFFIKVFLVTILGLLPIFGTLVAEEKDGLETIYHIYIDDLHVGAVDSKDVAQEIINEKVLLGLETYENLEISLGETISMIPERSFQSTYDNEEVVEYLEEHLTIVARAEAIKIDDQVVGYFQNKKEAEEVLRAYKLKYVTEEQLARIENADEEGSTEKESDLSVGDVVLLDVTFSKNVSLQTKTTEPDNILNIEQGIKLLEKGTLEEKKHKVSEGEVLGKIAKQYDLSTKKLLALNPKLTEESVLQVGQKINVAAYEPFVDVLTIEEEKIKENIDYKVEIVETEDMYKGEEKVKQKGKNGTKEVQHRIEKKNGEVIDKETLSEDVTKKAVDKVIMQGTKVIPSRGTGDLSWPTDGGYISSQQGSRWGSFHKGIDIAGPTSRTISAADHGVVESVGYNGGYGNKIVINHNNGMKTIYAHLDSFDVKAGQVVEKGMKIGVMGSTGNSTGIHLHFEVYQSNELQNPTKYF